MQTKFQTGTLSNHDLASPDAVQFERLCGWPRLLDLSRSQRTLAVLATLITLVLMLAFHQVVLGAVAQGESLQQARNLQSQAFWRCNRLLSPVERDNCQFRINAEVSASAP
jgi:hypothetical protein